ncbi:MAG TPA: sigma-70 family RNA polymerase sigma factor [Actinomycetota bacterium]|nr:sigma-70 family RNA polymerase sigma factor [Actinomycetota bacterium]
MADRAGFEAFYAAHLPRVVRACALVLLDRAESEDVAAEAFARLWSHWGRIHGEDHAGGYVFTTAMRLCSKRRRRAAREVVGAVPERGAPAGDPTDRGAVIDALRTLPLRQRQSVVLRDWAGFPTQEVARILGAKESTVRVHLARGRAALRERLTVEEREG